MSEGLPLSQEAIEAGARVLNHSGIYWPNLYQPFQARLLAESRRVLSAGLPVERTRWIESLLTDENLERADPRGARYGLSYLGMRQMVRDVLGLLEGEETQ